MFDYIVTGSSGFIGKIVVQELKKQDFSVLELDIKLGIDLNDEKVVKTVFKEHKGRNLVNFFAMNAKFSDAGFTNSFLDIELSYFREVLNVNLISLFSVNREFIRNNSSGVIVNISSIYGVVAPNPKLYSGSEKPIPYGVSKAGVIQLSKHLATHAAPNFRVNSVVIGGVLESQGERFINAYSAGVPLGRMANPEEIVGVVKFLTTDESSYVTGSVVTVDGGWTAW